MKKLIFILLTFIVALGAYCQTNYGLSYDTVSVRKRTVTGWNGSGYLNASKGNFADSLWHRITLATGDSSKLSATTEWVKRQGYGSGGGGGSTLTRQVITSGSPTTVSTGNSIVTLNFASAQSEFILTLPASPSDQNVVNIEIGGALTTGMSVNSFLLLPNSGQSIIGVIPPMLQVGDYLSVEYRGATNQWLLH